VNLAQICSAVPEIFHTQTKNTQTDGAKNRTFRSSLPFTACDNNNNIKLGICVHRAFTESDSLQSAQVRRVLTRNPHSFTCHPHGHVRPQIERAILTVTPQPQSVTVLVHLHHLWVKLEGQDRRSKVKSSRSQVDEKSSLIGCGRMLRRDVVLAVCRVLCA